jgi:hypothetical protein
LSNAALVSSDDAGFNNDGVWAEIPSGANMEFLDAEDKNDDTTGCATDGDVFLMSLELQ